MYIVGLRLRCIRQHFQNGSVWTTPIVSAFSGTRPPSVRSATHFGMNTSGIRDVERKIKELNQL
jgi:hypothetical protein